jgi:outer membrane protein OmpA-like peptidoglycan-associated protein
VPPGSGGGRVAVNTTTLSDAALGFKPSTAPALDPSISEWVAPPIVARFQQTAAQAGQRADMRVVANVPGGSQTSTYAAIGARTPTASILFPGDGTVLSAQGRAQVRSVAQAFKAQGGQGTVRVVGHASSRTANMPVEQHLKVIFEKSQSRANAVAQELIKQGVPAPKVLIEAVGDSQPIYYESMPEGENGNRRAEIFLQG